MKKKFNYLWIVYVIMFVMTIASASSVSQDDLLNGLVSYYNMDETSGTTAVDSHGSNDGTISGATIDQTGKINKAYSFDGTNDYVDLNTIFTDNNFSVGGWIYISGGTGVRQIVGNSYFSSYLRGWSLDITSANKLRLFIGNNFAGEGITESSSTLNSSTWYHVMGTYDYDSKTVKIYLNGELETTNIMSNVISYTGITQNTKIGRYAHSGAEYWNGFLDEILYINRAWNSTEVSALYDIQKDGYTNGTYNFSALAEPEGNATYFTVGLKDFNTNDTINTFRATVNGTSYSTTDGLVTTTIETGSGSFDVVFDRIGGEGTESHFDFTVTSHNTASNLVSSGAKQFVLNVQDSFNHDDVNGMLYYLLAEYCCPLGEECEPLVLTCEDDTSFSSGEYKGVLGNPARTFTDKIIIGGTNYFNETVNDVNLLNPLTVYIDRARLNITVKEVITNETISNWDLMIFPSVLPNNFWHEYTRVPGEESSTSIVSRSANTFAIGKTITTHESYFVEQINVEQRTNSATSGRESEVYALWYYEDGTTYQGETQSTSSTSYVDFWHTHPYSYKRINKIELWHRSVSSSASYSSYIRNVYVTHYGNETKTYNNVNEIIGISNTGINNSVFHVAVNKDNYFVLNNEINVTSQTTYNLEYFLYTSLLTVNVRNAWSNNTISNFTGWISNDALSYNKTFNSTTGTIDLGILSGYNYTVYIEAENYAINPLLNYANISVNETTHELNFGLYSDNSILTFVRRETDNTLILQNVSVKVTSGEYDETFYTTTGSYLIENLSDGVYEVRFSAENFTSRSYTVTVTDRSTQTLTGFLTGETNTVIFTVLDSGNNNALEGARVSMYRLTNGEWVTVESKLSDITGKVLLSYIVDDRYRFIVSKDDYASRTFELNPILLPEYNVRLTKLESFPNIPQSFTVSVNFMPKYFNKGANNFTIFFNSPEGRFSNYGFNLTYPGETYSYSNNNAVGESKLVSVVIDDEIAEYGDYVTLIYFYTVVGGQEQSFEFRLPIRDLASDLTIFDNLNNKYDLNAFEKLIIMTLIIILVGGISILTAGQQTGGVVIMMLFGLFSFMGFVPVWTIAIIILVAITYITSDRVRS
jgi:hypothetical protein